MKIDLDWIQKELDAGRKVELEGCGACYINEDNYVLNIDGDDLVVSLGAGKMWIPSDNFKHFRIKRNEPTFDDLIDVAVQAYKDGVCDSVEIDINNWLIVKSSTGNIHCHKNHLIHDNEFHINWIKSLYKETFVIETEEDLDRFNKDVEITLANDEKLSWEDLKSIGLMNTHAIFKALKSATVTQKRG